MTYPAKQISISINIKPAEVYSFLCEPTNLPKWAYGLSQSNMKKEGEYWVTESPMGKVKVKFCEKNSMGVVDHDVVLPSGEVNHNPFRVVRNGEGSEVIFTLYRLPKMSENDFKRDTEFVISDLQRLKTVLEKTV